MYAVDFYELEFHFFVCSKYAIFQDLWLDSYVALPYRTPYTHTFLCRKPLEDILLDTCSIYACQKYIITYCAPSTTQVSTARKFLSADALTYWE